MLRFMYFVNGMTLSLCITFIMRDQFSIYPYFLLTGVAVSLFCIEMGQRLKKEGEN